LIWEEAAMWGSALLRSIPGRCGRLLRNLLIPYRHGKRVTISSGVYLLWPRRLEIGERSFVNVGCVINAYGTVSIGDHVLIGRNVHIYSVNHRFESVEMPIGQQGFVAKPVVIGSNVWIGSNVTIVPGVEIGPNTVIAAGSVVTRPVEGGVLVAGNPAGVVRRLESGEIEEIAERPCAEEA
jgi:maltose O-acetyltransferase